MLAWQSRRNMSKILWLCLVSVENVCKGEGQIWEGD